MKMMWKDKDSKLSGLASIDGLSHLPTRTLRQVLPLTTMVCAPVGTVLWRQGETSREAFMLVDGETELTWHGMRGEVVKPGAIIGGVGLVAGAPRVATAACRSDVTMLVMCRSEYEQLLSLCPDVAGAVQAGFRLRFPVRHPATS